MAIVKMQKLNIFGLNSDKEKILSHLQKLGAIEINDIHPDLIKKILGEDSYFEGKEDLDFDIAEIKFAIDFLTKYYTGKKPGLLESFIGDQEAVTKNEFENAKKLDYPSIINEVTELDKTITSCDSKIEKIKTELKELENWKNIDFRIEDITNLENYSFMVGTISKNEWTSFSKKINSLTAHYETYDKVEDKDKLVTIIYKNDEKTEKDISKIMSEYNFKAVDFIKKYKFSPKEEIANLSSELKKTEAKKKEAIENAKKLADKRKSLMCVYDKLSWKEDRLSTGQKAITTKYSFMLSAWARSQDVEPIKKELEKISKATEVEKIDPEKGEQPPVELHNGKFMRPFEAVTNIYGMPKYTELDPTGFLSIFFIIFLALCLTDAGYGIVMIILTYWMLKKVDLPDKRLVTLLNYGGWATLVIGALCGGWFGIEIASLQWPWLKNTLESMQIINPVENPLTMMGVALLLGIIQIWFGIFVKFYWKVKNKMTRDAVIDEGPWLLLIPSLMFFALVKTGVLSSSLTTVSTYLLYAILILTVLSKGREQKNILLKIPVGVLGLYDLVGYFSDTLSYSRLLALGLATGIIGFVINMIASLFKGVPVVGWLLFIVILVGGHTFNISINLLGSFIHSARLQYVEFFTKFMEGGGNKFNPFSQKNTYTKIKNN